MTRPPSRLKDAELAQLLVATGQNVGSPPRGAMQRTLQRLEAVASAGLLATGAGLGAAEAATQGSALLSCATSSAGTATAGMGGFSAAKAVASSLVTKWFASGLAVGLVAGGGAVGVAVGGHAYWRLAQAPALASERPNESRTLPKGPTKGPSGVVAARKATEPVPIQADPASADARRGLGQPSEAAILPEVGRKHATPFPDQPTESSLSPELARELSLLDLARSAIERGDRQRALYWLARHGQQFPNGQLAPEAALLRAQTESQVVGGKAPHGDAHE